MSNFDDDEDEFLYGSEGPNVKRQKTTATKDDDEVIAEATEDTKSAVPPAAPATAVGPGDDNEEDEEGEDDEDDEDSDIEFVIDTKPGQKAEAPSKQAPYSTSKATAAATTGDETAADSTGAVVSKENQKASGEKPPGIDIEAVAEHNGRPITEISLEELEDKPWRKPGADITDYFNYGFDEFTWTAYCSKQDNLRDTFTPQKVMAMMGMPVFPPEMMGFGQGFPGMPGMPAPGMGGQFVPPPGFMGMGNDDSGAYGGSNIVAGGSNSAPVANYRRK